MKTLDERAAEIRDSEDVSWLFGILAEAKRERHGRLARRVLEALNGNEDELWLLSEDKAFGERH